MFSLILKTESIMPVSGVARGGTGGLCRCYLVLTPCFEWCKFEEKIWALPWTSLGGSAPRPSIRPALCVRHDAST